ncbi:MAG TPA: dihydroorotate dehydrogenase [Bacteroidota bacterium]|jgi:dihydroorotate dehydrogenase (NAD+) catalytic subunit|nr:dihydroorotate dehydrogenase [Bacteroidota bacterium]
MINMQVTIGSLVLKNPVLTASGTFGYGDDCRDLVDVNELGGIVTKSLSMKPRDGNPPVRIVETPSGMLNSIGLANIGVKKFVDEKLPYLQTLKTAIVANIAASSVEEYCSVLNVLEEQSGIDGYEINVSCPNVKEGGLSFGTDRKMTAEITRRLRTLTKKSLIIKLTPNVTHISEFARAVADEGADAVSVINTVIGMAIDIKKRKPKLSTVTGGLSGPAIKPVALAKVYEVAQAVKIPIFGIGGIMTAEDAIEFMLAGATAVQVGTANFMNPNAGVTIAQAIQSYCQEHNIPDVRQLTGAVQASKELSAISSWL